MGDVDVARRVAGDLSRDRSEDPRATACAATVRADSTLENTRSRSSSIRSTSTLPYAHSTRSSEPRADASRAAVRAVPSSRALKDVARPCLVDLHAMTGEVAVLSSIDGERMVVADVIAGRTAFRSWTAPRNMPIAGTAPGRVMLAHLPLEESRRLLERADAEITHQASDFGLRQQLGEIRRTGVAVAPFAGKVWVSAPIFDEVGAIRSTISAVADQDHHNLPGLTHIVTGAARAVSQGLRERAASAV